MGGSSGEKPCVSYNWRLPGRSVRTLDRRGPASLNATSASLIAHCPPRARTEGGMVGLEHQVVSRRMPGRVASMRTGQGALAAGEAAFPGPVRPDRIDVEC